MQYSLTAEAHSDVIFWKRRHHALLPHSWKWRCLNFWKTAHKFETCLAIHFSLKTVWHTKLVLCKTLSRRKGSLVQKVIRISKRKTSLRETTLIVIAADLSRDSSVNFKLIPPPCPSHRASSLLLDLTFVNDSIAFLYCSCFASTSPSAKKMEKVPSCSPSPKSDIAAWDGREK